MTSSELIIEPVTNLTDISIHYELFELNREEQEEIAPGEPFTAKQPTKEKLEKEKSVKKPVVIKRWYVGLNQNIIGFAFYLKNNPNFPHSEFKEDEAFFHIFISKKYRRRGIGTKVLNYLKQQAHNEGINILITNTKLDHSTTFLEKHNFNITKSVKVENRLYVDEINHNNYDHFLQISIPSNYILEIVNTIREIDLDQYCEIYNYLANNTTVKTERDGDSQITAESIRAMEREYEINSIIWYSAILKNEKGKIIGITEMIFDPETPGKIRQNLTGVLPDYRQNGYGKFLKAKLMEHVIENHSEVSYITTSTDITNEPMQYINEKLGFKKEDIINYVCIYNYTSN